MPIRVVTKEVRYIYELSLTLEHSMPVSSPAAPGLTEASNIWVIPRQWKAFRPPMPTEPGIGALLLYNPTCAYSDNKL